MGRFFKVSGPLMSGKHHQNLKQLKKLNVKHQKQYKSINLHPPAYTIT
jgi:ABC-type taurine transport system substrate-binding protein